MAIATATAIRGTARLGRRTKELVKRLGPSDIAVIDHRNLDRIAAEELVASGARAALNASPSSDGSYPNTGPLALVRSGVPLIDAGPGLFELIADGDRLQVDGGRISSEGTLIAEDGRCGRSSSLATWRRSARGSTGRSTTSPRTRWPTSARREDFSSARSTCRRRAPASAIGTC